MPAVNDCEVDSDIELVRTRRSSELKPPGESLAPSGRSFSITYVFEYLCTLGWVCLFLMFPLSCWIVWLGLLAWLTIGATQLCYSFVTSSSPVASVIADPNLFRFVAVLLFVLIYQFHWLRDRGAEERGSHPKPAFRNLIIWHYLQQYFPIQLILSKEIQHERLVDDAETRQMNQDAVARSVLQSIHQSSTKRAVEIVSNPALFSADQNYIMGYHPHGIFGVGAFVNFATEATGFSRKFPGITPWLTTLELNFKAPFHRDLLLKFNIVAATYKGISHLLNPEQCGKKGNMVVIVLGGAPEALDSRPGKYVFHTNRRYGFFKLALMTGSALVPCVSFGEPNMYRQVQNPPGCKLRCWQDRFTEVATFSPPIFYAHILSPFRTPVNTVVGAPIPVGKVEKPSREQVSALKTLYLKNLNELFQRHKPIYDPGADDLEFF